MRGFNFSDSHFHGCIVFPHASKVDMPLSITFRVQDCWRFSCTPAGGVSFITHLMSSAFSGRKYPQMGLLCVSPSDMAWWSYSSSYPVDQARRVCGSHYCSVPSAPDYHIVFPSDIYITLILISTMPLSGAIHLRPLA